MQFGKVYRGGSKILKALSGDNTEADIRIVFGVNGSYGPYDNQRKSILKAQNVSQSNNVMDYQFYTGIRNIDIPAGFTTIFYVPNKRWPGSAMEVDPWNNANPPLFIIQNIPEGQSTGPDGGDFEIKFTVPDSNE